jgi:hypothetical protein
MGETVSCLPYRRLQGWGATFGPQKHLTAFFVQLAGSPLLKAISVPSTAV